MQTDNGFKTRGSMGSFFTSQSFCPLKRDDDKHIDDHYSFAFSKIKPKGKKMSFHKRKRVSSDDDDEEPLKQKKAKNEKRGEKDTPIGCAACKAMEQ